VRKSEEFPTKDSKKRNKNKIKRGGKQNMYSKSRTCKDIIWWNAYFYILQQNIYSTFFDSIPCQNFPWNLCLKGQTVTP